MSGFGVQVIGQTEKALNAILARELEGSGITEAQWIALTLTVTSDGTLTGDELAERIAGVLKVDRAVARERITELNAADLVATGHDNTVSATERGRAQWGEVRTATTRIADGLWGDLPEEDLATAGRVLTTVLGRANALLSIA